MHFLPMRALLVSVFGCVCYVSVCAGGNGTSSKYPALLAFGDSILDTGNNNMLPTIVKCNFPPYGKDFIGHEPTGSFSNGKVPSDFVASKLGIKELLPAFLNPNLSNEDLLTGVSFASGSSGYDRLTSELLSVISIRHQLELFKDYKKKLKAVTEPERAEMIVRESLYFVCSGSNDYANNYFRGALRSAEYDIPSYTSFLVDSASNFIQDLYNLGARKMLVVGLPPLGCVPNLRTRAGGEQRDCASLYNQVSEDYNLKLSTTLQILQKKLAGSNIVYADIYHLLLGLIQYPSKYGFEESKKGCCGTGEFELGPSCNKKTVVS